MLTYSIAMSTYNGELYIYKQLESLKNQIRKADEVIICDDGSKDQTINIIEKYINENHLDDTWKLYINEKNKGCVRNFMDCAERTTGDVVFFCDQDDIWDSRKTEHMMQGFEQNAKMLACYCLRDYIDENDCKIKLKFQFMSNPKKRKLYQKVSLNEAIKFNKSPGLCLAFRREMLNELKSLILNNDLTHDLPIGTVAAIKGEYFVLNEELVQYRQHGFNVSSPRYTVHDRIFKIEQQIQGRKVRYKQMQAIYNSYKEYFRARDKKNLQRAIYTTKRSIELLETRNILGLAKELINFNPMINNWILINNFLTCILVKRS